MLCEHYLVGLEYGKKRTGYLAASSPDAIGVSVFGTHGCLCYDHGYFEGRYGTALSKGRNGQHDPKCSCGKAARALTFNA